MTLRRDCLSASGGTVVYWLPWLGRAVDGQRNRLAAAGGGAGAGLTLLTVADGRRISRKTADSTYTSVGNSSLMPLKYRRFSLSSMPDVRAAT